MYRKHKKDKLIGLIVACSALGMSQAAEATVVNAKSDGYAALVDLNVNVLGVLQGPVKLGPIPGGVMGEAPMGYNEMESTLSAEIPGILEINALWGTANSDVDGSNGNKTTDAFGEIAGLTLNVLNLITLDLGVINATASVTGDYGTMVASADSTVALLAATVLGAPVNLSVDPSGELDLLGISVVLNEQIEDCSVSFCSIESNAIHINFDNLALNPLLGDLLTGDIILGHAYAEMSAAETAPPVPVPAAVWLFGSGIMGLVGFARRRQTQVIA